MRAVCCVIYSWSCVSGVGCWEVREKERESAISWGCHRLVGLPLVWDGHRVMGLPSEWDVWHIMGLPMARSCHRHRAVIVLWSCHRCGSAVILWACHHLPGQPSRCPAALQPPMTPQHCKHTAVLCAVFLRPLAFKDPQYLSAALMMAAAHFAPHQS